MSEAPSTVDQQRFREAMASLSAAVCLVTAGSGQLRLGRTVTAGFSLGLKPPAILVSIATDADLTGRIRDERASSHSVLSDSQTAVADAFAGKAVPERRFEHGDWREWSSGQPRLNGAVASLDCAVISEIELDDHVLFVGAVRDIDRQPDARPLVWFGRRFHKIAPL